MPGENKPPAAAAEVMKLVELLISWLLLCGLLVSMATVLVGLVLMFVQHPEFLRSAATSSGGETAQGSAAEAPATDGFRRPAEPAGHPGHPLAGRGSAFPHTLGQIVRGVAEGSGQAIMALGLVLLVATPILRVVISMVGFAVQRDHTYTAITAVVLIVLLISFFLGKVE